MTGGGDHIGQKDAVLAALRQGEAWFQSKLSPSPSGGLLLPMSNSGTRKELQSMPPIALSQCHVYLHAASKLRI